MVSVVTGFVFWWLVLSQESRVGGKCCRGSRFIMVSVVVRVQC